MLAWYLHEHRHPDINGKFYVSQLYFYPSSHPYMLALLNLVDIFQISNNTIHKT